MSTGSWASDLGRGGSGGADIYYESGEAHHAGTFCVKIMGGYKALDRHGRMRAVAGPDIAADCRQINADKKYYNASMTEKSNYELSAMDVHGRQLSDPKTTLKILRNSFDAGLEHDVLYRGLLGFKASRDIPLTMRSSGASAMKSYLEHSRSSFLCQDRLAFVDLTAPRDQRRFFIVNLKTGRVRSTFFQHSSGGQCVSKLGLQRGSFNPSVGAHIFAGVKACGQGKKCLLFRRLEHSGLAEERTFAVVSPGIPINDPESIGRLSKSASRTFRGIASESCRPFVYFYPDVTELRQPPAFRYWNAKCSANNTESIFRE